MARFFFLLLALIMPLALFASVTAPLIVPEAGEHYYWFVYTDLKGNAVQTTPKGFKDKRTTVDLPLVKDAVRKCKLFVLDGKTGNEAIVEVIPKKDQPLKFELKAGDFDTVRRVEIAVSRADNGEPAAAAIVEIKDSDGKVQTQVLDSTARGVAQFFDVASGTARVTIIYGEDRTMSQDIDIPLERKSVVARIDVPVVGDIETLAMSTKEAKGTGAEEEEAGAPKGSRYDWISGIIGLVLFIVIVYAAHRLLSNKGLRAISLLRKLGVDVRTDEQPGEGASQPAQQVDPTICSFCGGKKDPVTGSCACTIPRPGEAITPPSSGPRLIATQGSYMGEIYPLEGASITIGRDESCNISLSKDPTVSRRHARITTEGGQWKIHDEGSSNGTFVNGIRISEQVIKPGDEITIGTTSFRFEL